MISVCVYYEVYRKAKAQQTTYVHVYSRLALIQEKLQGNSQNTPTETYATAAKDFGHCVHILRVN